MALLGLYVIVRPCLRYWLYRPALERPVFLRHSEAARIADFILWIILIAGAFLLLNSYPMPRAGIVIIGILVYDFVMKFILLHIEVLRLKSKAPKWSYRDAMRHVRERARSMLSP